MNDPLRRCPTCMTPVAEAALALRDYSSWLGDALPGRVAPMDVDFMLERHGHFLIIEFKPANGHVPKGQLITLKALEKMGAEVWLVRGDGPRVTVEVLLNGEWMPPFDITVDELAKETRVWFEEMS